MSTRFLALKTGVDVLDEVCGGVGYWPYNFPCAEAVVTEVICGDGSMVGGPIWLPSWLNATAWTGPECPVKMCSS